MTPTSPEFPTATVSGSLTPERFARARAIFEAALDRPVVERPAFVDGACVNDEPLRREVLGMLSADALERPEAAVHAGHASTPEEGRFPAGTVLAGRYRVLGLLGAGGMGEVYRAYDLILNQTVALKFLAPAHISEAALVRFRNEVRVARQVSHPNVCRVYDLGMVEGLHFLSMEYIDGENLASLLRRIGRLPQDKAIELTRKICAGLLAAHERGVLHRDLKPANIMIDGRGQPRITDFGLAGLAAEIPLSDLRSGTPAYMSPEQKAGREVTVRSDIYTLGLVLYEMFTGKARSGSASSPSEVITDLDPAIDRLIRRCLDDDPQQRPASAMHVAVALPGGDPIAAALAAGETPSPEMVAASQEQEGFSARTATILFAALVSSLILGVSLARSIDFTARAPLPMSGDQLAVLAAQVLRGAGYTEGAQDIAYDFDCCDERVQGYLSGRNRAERDEILASHRPPINVFWYREHSRGRFFPLENLTPVTIDSPPHHKAGMQMVTMDPRGRLLRFQVQAWTDAPAAAPSDWSVFFDKAEIDQSRLSSTSPQAILQMAADTQWAWTGQPLEGRPDRVRVEAAAFKGRPVWFDVQWLPAAAPPPAATALLQSIQRRFAGGFRLLTLLAVPIMAWRNWRQHRVDVRGALLLVAVSFLAVVSSRESLGLVLLWLTYVAVEPEVRRNWPDALISWQRLSHGRWRDPLVASHILVGLTAAVVFAMVAFPILSTLTTDVPMSGTGRVLSAPSLWRLTLPQAVGPVTAMGYLTAIVLCRLLLRHLWTADVVALAWFSLISISVAPSGSWLVPAFFLAANFTWLWLMRRFGFLTFLTMFTFAPLLWLPHYMYGWLGQRLWPAHLIPIALAAFCLWVIVSANQRQIRAFA